MTMIETFQRGLGIIASSRTYKYFIQSKDFNESCTNYVFTCLTLRSKKSNTDVIDVEGVPCKVNEYPILTSFAELCKAGRVWVTCSGQHYKEAYYESETPDNDGDFNGAKLLLPDEMAAFVNRFNSTQESGSNLTMEYLDYSNPVGLSDLPALWNKDELVSWGNEGNVKFSEEVAQLNEIPCPIEDSKYLVSRGVCTDLEVARWLVGTKNLKITE